MGRQRPPSATPIADYVLNGRGVMWEGHRQGHTSGITHRHCLQVILWSPDIDACSAGVNLVSLDNDVPPHKVACRVTECQAGDTLMKGSVATQVVLCQDNRKLKMAGCAHNSQSKVRNSQHELAKKMSQDKATELPDIMHTPQCVRETPRHKAGRHLT